MADAKDRQRARLQVEAREAAEMYVCRDERERIDALIREEAAEAARQWQQAAVNAESERIHQLANVAAAENTAEEVNKNEQAAEEDKALRQSWADASEAQSCEDEAAVFTNNVDSSAADEIVDDAAIEAERVASANRSAAAKRTAAIKEKRPSKVGSQRARPMFKLKLRGKSSNSLRTVECLAKPRSRLQKHFFKRRSPFVIVARGLILPLWRQGKHTHSIKNGRTQ